MSEPTPPVDEQPQADQPAADTAASTSKLPALKEDLVDLAIKRGIPSYEAWALTVPQLTEKLGD